MRNPRAIHYALLGMISQNPGGIHGYALKRQCDRVLGSFWQLNFGEVYRVLDRLAEDGLIETGRSTPGSSRKVFRITESGRASLDSYILEPPTDLPRPLRQELVVKLLFASAARMPELQRMIDDQRVAYTQQLHLLALQRRKLRRSSFDSFVVDLLIDGAELSVRAEFAWLDNVAQRLKERFTQEQYD